MRSEIGANVLARHDAVRAAVRLRVITVTFGTVASANANSSFAPCLIDAAILLDGAWQEPRHVLEGHERNVERVAEAHETARPSRRRRLSERAGEHGRLVGDDADGAAVQPGEPDENVLREVLDAPRGKYPSSDDGVDDVEHVVRLGGRRRHHSDRAPVFAGR